MPKSDTFLGISLDSKCVTFKHDSVVPTEKVKTVIGCYFLLHNF